VGYSRDKLRYSDGNEAQDRELKAVELYDSNYLQDRHLPSCLKQYTAELYPTYILRFESSSIFRNDAYCDSRMKDHGTVQILIIEDIIPTVGVSPHP
jgi:hypothetical protein